MLKRSFPSLCSDELCSSCHPHVPAPGATLEEEPGRPPHSCLLASHPWGQVGGWSKKDQLLKGLELLKVQQKGFLEQVNPGRRRMKFRRAPDLAKCPPLLFKPMQKTQLFPQARQERLSFEIPEQTGVCVLMAGDGCGRRKGELPPQYADQCWRLAGQDWGSDVIMAVDVPSQSAAVQTSSPPFPWLIGISRGNAHAHPPLCAWIHAYTVCFELPVLCSEPESVRFLGSTQNYFPRINNDTLRSIFFCLNGSSIITCCQSCLVMRS